jgi:hypothetical protein
MTFKEIAMKTIYRSLILSLALFLAAGMVFAGNEDRSGQAGASELLINPWAAGSGWGGANTACGRGVEAGYLNVAGIAFTRSTEMVFSRADYLKGSGTTISSFGFTQSLGKGKGVIGLSISSMTFGEIEITTVDLPDGGIGTFSPSLMNIGISYAKAFSRSIYGGISLKIISESISDATAQGVAIDAGIQYVTGENENIKFGISMKNVGPTLHFSGDGFSIRGMLSGDPYLLTMEQRSANFELPSLITIGAAYDINFNKDNVLTLAGNFTSNSFTKDQFHFGAQYSFKEYVQLRSGYVYEKETKNISAQTGLSAGFSVNLPLNKEKGSLFAIDYSFRDSNPFMGTHTIGARITL